MTESLVMILLILLLIILVILCLLVLNMMKENRAGQQRLLLKNQEAIGQQKKTTQDFQAILNQIQSLNRSQSQDSQSLDWILEQMDEITRTMTNPKARGSWGEYQLETILSNYAGSHPNVFSMQYPLASGRIADAVLHLPDSQRVLCIDSKFPMENYLRMDDYPEQAEHYYREFKKNIKKHIDDIAARYITPETASQAILFIPSEAIYQFVCSRCSDLFQYALNCHVMLASPTTLAGIVFTLIGSHRDFYRAANLDQMEKKLLSLQSDIERLENRVGKAQKSLEAASNSMSLVNVSMQAIANKYEKLLSGSSKEEL